MAGCMSIMFPTYSYIPLMVVFALNISTLLEQLITQPWQNLLGFCVLQDGQNGKSCG
jgi:hypothetical protein